MIDKKTIDAIASILVFLLFISVIVLLKPQILYLQNIIQDIVLVSMINGIALLSFVSIGGALLSAAFVWFLLNYYSRILKNTQMG